MSDVDKLKLVEIIGSQIVELAFVVLFSYIAKLASDYLHYRRSTTGKPIFEPQPEENKQ